jgi:hypothetical protein
MTHLALMLLVRLSSVDVGVTTVVVSCWLWVELIVVLFSGKVVVAGGVDVS